MSNIERFKRDKKVLTTKEINNVLSLYDGGYLQAMKDYENLIIPVVICTFKEKCKKEIEELESELIKLREDKIYAKLYADSWNNEQIFLEGKINGIKTTLNYL